MEDRELCLKGSRKYVHTEGAMALTCHRSVCPPCLVVTHPGQGWYAMPVSAVEPRLADWCVAWTVQWGPAGKGEGTPPPCPSQLLSLICGLGPFYFV